MTPARDAGGAATEAAPTGLSIVHTWIRSDATGVAIKMLATPDRMWPLVEAIDAALALGPAQPDAVALREEVGRLRSLLRRCEWVGRMHGPKFCPVCAGRRGCAGLPDEGHAPGCALAAELDPDPGPGAAGASAGGGDG